MPRDLGIGMPDDEATVDDVGDDVDDAVPTQDNLP
jgi:hypothetical protein